LGGIGDFGSVGGRATDVAVAFEDFLGGDFRRVVEEGRVIQNGLEIFWDLDLGLTDCAKCW